MLTSRTADCCLRLLGKIPPEEFVREEFESLGICVQGFLQHHSGRRDKEASNARPLTLNFIVSVAWRLDV
jgi:hypothetical protein